MLAFIESLSCLIANCCFNNLLINILIKEYIKSEIVMMLFIPLLKLIIKSALMYQKTLLVLSYLKLITDMQPLQQKVQIFNFRGSKRKEPGNV